MENKQITLMKSRIGELEKLHNRLTAIVVHLYHDNQKMKKFIAEQKSLNLSNEMESSGSQSNDVDNLILNNNSDSNERANKILEELKKAQHS